MKKLLIAASILLAACGGARAQVSNAVTVAACGTQTYPAGQPYPVSQTLTGNLCDSGGGGGGGGTTLTPSTTGGLSMFTSSVGNSAVAVRGQQAGFYGYVIYNPNSTACYLQVYDATQGSVTVGTTNPNQSFGIPALGGANIALTIPLQFNTAIAVAATGGAGDASSCGAFMRVNIWFK